MNKWILLPVFLLIALFLALYMNQPPVIENDDPGYVDVDGDEYLDLEYISEKEEGIGDFDVPDYYPETFQPVDLEDCENKEYESSKDTCYWQYGIAEGDPRACEAATERNVKDDCFSQVALINKTPELCENVVIGKAQCYADVAIETNDAALCERGDDEIEQCLAAVESGNYSDCPDSIDRRVCNEAVLRGDSAICTGGYTYETECYNAYTDTYESCTVTDRIENQKEFCYLQIAISTKQPSLCNKTGSSENTCFFRIATETNNANICENLEETRDNCVAWVALNTNNRELCFEAGSETQSCLQELA